MRLAFTLLSSLAMDLRLTFQVCLRDELPFKSTEQTLKIVGINLQVACFLCGF